MWNLLFSSEYHRDAASPVEPIYVPGSLSWPVIRVRVFSHAAPISWRVAGELVQIFDPMGGLDIEGASVVLPLNAYKLIHFPEFDSEEFYSLKFYPKRWIENYGIQIEQYI
ncbi:hypothetical protein QUB36_13545 [Microcoleus sp. AT8-B1]|uniref:hypothetical protein n=1 Tax=unclassified Microcoleus TaxID=2642155 RepID=UPI002FD53A19